MDDGHRKMKELGGEGQEEEEEKREVRIEKHTLS